MAGCPKLRLGLLVVSVFACVGGGLAQSEIDAVHIQPRQPVEMSEVSNLMLPDVAAGAAMVHKNVDLVLVPVVVTDSWNRLVVGLQKENFQVFEGKKSQEIRNFSSEDAPVSIGIVLDVSGSMKSKMDRAREAVKQFCEVANPQDEMFLVTFANAPTLLTEFTTHPEELENKLLPEIARGQTALLDSIYLALREMQKAKYSRKALLIISDGGDNHSRYTEDEIKSQIKEADVAIYTVGTYDRYVPTQEELLGPVLLEDIAEATGGQSFTLENPNDLPQAAARIGQEIRRQYVIAYRPGSERDGKWHKIDVKLKLSSKLGFLRVHAKQGYYATGE